MSNHTNQHIIDSAMEVAGDLDEIESSGHLNNVLEYIKDNDLDSLFHYLKEMNIISRAYKDLERLEYCE